MPDGINPSLIIQKQRVMRTNRCTQKENEFLLEIVQLLWIHSVLCVGNAEIVVFIRTPYECFVR